MFWIHFVFDDGKKTCLSNRTMPSTYARFANLSKIDFDITSLWVDSSWRTFMRLDTTSPKITDLNVNHSGRRGFSGNVEYQVLIVIYRSIRALVLVAYRVSSAKKVQSLPYMLPKTQIPRPTPVTLE